MAPPTVRLENDKVRVVEFRLAPGDKTTMHTHPEPYVAYVLGSARVKISFPDGKSVDAQMKAGEVLWRAPMTHAFENVGNTELRELLVAIKTSA
jgi:quercetin dioxygenase-like cupin family protein